MIQNRRGRPTGYKMSDLSKEQIRQTKLGTTRSEETKKRISEGVRTRMTGAPIELIMMTDLDKCKKHFNNRYINIYIPNTELNKRGWWMREHVAVIEQHLGRKLLPGEETHHIDEDKTNNNKSNLLILTIKAHRKLHAILRRAKRIGE